MYTMPKKFLIFRGKPLIKSFSDVFVRIEVPLSKHPSTKTDSQKVPGLVSKQDGVALPSWVSPSSFGPLLTCAMMRCSGGKSACHVFSDNVPFFTQSTMQFDQLLVVAVSINSFTRFLTTRSKWHPPDPTKRTASSSVRSDLILRKMLMVERDQPKISCV